MLLSTASELYLLTFKDGRSTWIHLLSTSPRIELKHLPLIDSEFRVDIFNNSELLTNIDQAKNPLKLHYNAGVINVSIKGWFRGIKVWFHPKGIANILFLKTLKNRHHVTYDSQDQDGFFKVHTNEVVV